jgi:hypothetical protein
MSMYKNSGSDELQMPHDLYGRPNSCKKHDMGAYVWLAYSVFFFIEPVLRHSERYWMKQLPIYVAFLALYIAYVEFEKRALRLWIIVAIFVLGVGSIPFNVGGSAFFIYVAALLPFCVESSLILVGTSFRAVLSTMRSPDFLRRLWASAICLWRRVSAPMPSCDGRRRRISSLPRSQNGNGLRVICTTFSDIR